MSRRITVLAAGLALALAALSAAASAQGSPGALWPADFDAEVTDCAGFSRDANDFCHIDDGGSVELGVKFRSSQALDVVGVRAYVTDAGPVTASLWTADGTRLAGPATITGFGWQDVLFSAPVSIVAGQTYIASYFTPNAQYAFEHFFFTNDAFTTGPVTALQSVTGDTNGVYCYVGESCAGFPANSFRDSNYWVTPLWNTAPTLSVPADLTVEGNATGGANVTYSGVSADDAEDGALTPSCTPADGSFLALGGPHQVTCSVTDSGGLSDTGSFTVTVQDTTAPSLAPHANETATATSASGATVSYTKPTATDVVDPDPGVACSPASGSTFPPGETTVTCTATDDSGNQGASSFKVVVRFAPWDFLAPIDTNKVLNSMKAGSTAPIKWRVSDGAGGVIGDVAIVQRTQSFVVGCATSAPVDDLGQYATGQTALRYDPTSSQYVYNWQSAKKPGTCWLVRITLTDGSFREATFSLR